MQQLLLTHWRAPGDIVCLTAAVRDLALSYPGRYEIHVAGSHPELWRENPHVAGVWGPRPPAGMPRHRISCQDALRASDVLRRHYLTAFHRDLERQLGLPLPTLLPRGDLHLSASEKSQRLVAEPYWLIVAGGKTDMPTKIWSAARFQAVVNRLRDQGLRCVQGGAEGSGHRQPRLRHVENYVGRTHLRGFLRLIYHADGVLCPVSFPMHVAAAFEKPCVVIAGGREPWWWAAYTNSPDGQFGDRCAPVAVPHRYLHTLGRYDCCRATGCWKTHVESTPMTSEADLCELPLVDADGGTLPRCLADITVDDVVSAILNTPSAALAGGPRN